MIARCVLASVVLCIALVGCGRASSSVEGTADASTLPVAIDIPSIETHSNLVPIGLAPDGKIAVPPTETPEQAGYYVNAPMPGARGPAIILGHVNGDGKPGIFVNLDRVREGDVINVLRLDGTTIRFRVTEVAQTPKDRFPTDRVYGSTNDAQIRLMTCGGIFDPTARSYDDNVIVYGVKIDG